MSNPPRHAADKKPIRASRPLQRVMDLILWALVAGVAVVMWPHSLGGMITFTVVQGNSMLPTYETGDLVIAWDGVEPSVGQVAVYRATELGGARIIHRIVDRDPNGKWILQGDNNDWLDPFKPDNEEVVGVAIFHIPKLGHLGAAVSNPVFALSLILIALGVALYPSKEEKEENGSSEPSDDHLPERERVVT